MTGLNLTEAHIRRHGPDKSNAQGREATLIDIAQDLLLRELAGQGLLDELVFKGGTAMRKLYAGNEGRFSTDLDFSVTNIEVDPEASLELLEEHITGLTIGPFAYGMRNRRGKRILTFNSPFAGEGSDLTSKLDIAAPPWLSPIRRGWEPMTIHANYGDPPLPELAVVRLEENIAEKIARLNRRTPARDMYDLSWIMANRRRTGALDLDLIRRLAVLKIWVDAQGMHAGKAHWAPVAEPAPFNPTHWLRERTDHEFDPEDVGALAVPVPTAAELSDALRAGYSFLEALDPDEQTIATINPKDRSLALRMVAELPGERLRQVGLF